MDWYRSILPQEGPLFSFNADMDSFRSTLPQEGTSFSFNAGSSVQSEWPSPIPSWCMKSFGSTLPEEGPTSFDVDSSVRSEGLPPFWGMDCYKPTLPNQGTTSFNAGLAVESEGLPPPPPSSGATENLSSYAQVDSCWTEGSFTRLLLEDEEFSFDSSPWTNNMPSLNESVRDGSAITTIVPIHNLISTPRFEVGVSSWETSFFQFGIANQDHPRQLDTQHHFDMFNWSTASYEKDRQASLSIFAQNYVGCNTSVATTFTGHLIEETRVLKKEGDQVIDLNKTRRHTTPKRYKYTPKVIKEDKQQRTPNTDKNEKCSSINRKYVHKNVMQMEVGSTSKEEPSRKRKYTKRLLNFDLRKDQSLKVDGEASNLSHSKEDPLLKVDFVPKVDLDPENDKAWKLIMMGGEGNEPQDEKTEKWWEAERKLFQGRIESFTARMHLIQGDRRFSKWKGSVLDSVIGVFLTQNVSDHLSSSAFMSLAAKFPIRKESQAQTCFKGEPSVTSECKLDHTMSSDLLKNVPIDSYHPNYFPQDYDEDLSWLKPKSKIETSRTCTSPITLSRDDQTTILEFQRPIDQYKPTNGGTSVGFMGTTFNLGNEIMPTIQEKATRYFKFFEEESIFFMDPSWSSVLNKGKRMQQENIFNKEASRHKEDKAIDWDSLRRQVEHNTRKKQRCIDAFDSLDFEALLKADVKEISSAIKGRGFNNLLAKNIKAFLNRLMDEHGTMDLEWLRNAPPDEVKNYLKSFQGIGLKSTECVRLLTLHQTAFPVDTNVGRIAVRLGWVPLQPLPESLQLHLLKEYPVLDSIQKYLWPRLCKLDQPTLYELHYQLITFGKVFCTKSKPNCNACPMKGECKHFASAFASAKQALLGPEEERIVTSTLSTVVEIKQGPSTYNSIPFYESGFIQSCEPIVEEPATPETERNDVIECDMEDALSKDPEYISIINLNLQKFTQNERTYIQENMERQEYNLSKALVALNAKDGSIPTPELKSVRRLRTEHLVYELPDSHPLLEKMDRREQDDPSPYLLAIWTPDETASNSTREALEQIVQGTLLVPCRTAMKGSFPLNGTYFQVNEMFADHKSSINPISVPRSLIWNLPRKTVYFGTSVTSIFRGMSVEEIQKCFWRGFVCVRGFDQKTRTPRPLIARLHFSAKRVVKKERYLVQSGNKEEEDIVENILIEPPPV